MADAAAFFAMQLSKRLDYGDRAARQILSIGAVVVAILLLVSGRSTTGLLISFGLLVSRLGALWLPNDARTFFGDQPLHIASP